MSELHSHRLVDLRRSLLNWYRRYGRKLPWRETHDPYAIWVSEIMLQQTQVAMVVDYYHRFLTRFPDVGSLAAADEGAVLAMWSGLGYYRRARQLHAAAQIVVEQFDGAFPTSFDDVYALPGIGRYTAGAIVSFAFNTPAPILEANTQRLFCRLLGLRADPKKTSSQVILWQFATNLLPPRVNQVGRLNQALIELGSQVCLPKTPRCTECPIADCCVAFRENLQAEIPVAAKRPPTTDLDHACVVIRQGSTVLIRKNPPGGWWEGLWDFPRTPLEKEPPVTHDPAVRGQIVDVERVEQALARELGLHCRPQRWLTTIKHAVTRYRITLYCFEAEWDAPRVALPPHGQWQWTSLSQLQQLPLTSTADKLARWLNVSV